VIERGDVVGEEGEEGAEGEEGEIGVGAILIPSAADAVCPAASVTRKA
jgi:hypothetical protein